MSEPTISRPLPVTPRARMDLSCVLSSDKLPQQRLRGADGIAGVRR